MKQNTATFEDKFFNKQKTVFDMIYHMHWHADMIDADSLVNFAERLQNRARTLDCPARTEYKLHDELHSALRVIDEAQQMLKVAQDLMHQQHLQMNALEEKWGKATL